MIIILLLLITSGFSSVPGDDPNCAIPNSIDNTCTKCQNSYFLGAVQCESCPKSTWSQGVDCQPCETACTECFGADISQCTSCAMDTIFQYYLNGNTCQLCGMAGPGFCANCESPHCTSCSYTNNQANCASCEDRCEQCPDTCLTCGLYSTDPITLYCYSCTEGNYLQGTDCFNCQSPCSKCKSLSVCDECTAGYYFDSTSQSNCSKCDDNCATCKDLSTYCMSCQSGLWLQANSCILKSCYARNALLLALVVNQQLFVIVAQTVIIYLQANATNALLHVPLVVHWILR